MQKNAPGDKLIQRTVSKHPEYAKYLQNFPQTSFNLISKRQCHENGVGVSLLAILFKSINEFRKQETSIIHSLKLTFLCLY